MPLAVRSYVSIPHNVSDIFPFARPLGKVDPPAGCRIVRGDHILQAEGIGLPHVAVYRDVDSSDNVIRDGIGSGEVAPAGGLAGVSNGLLGGLKGALEVSERTLVDVVQPLRLGGFSGGCLTVRDGSFDLPDEAVLGSRKGDLGVAECGLWRTGEESVGVHSLVRTKRTRPHSFHLVDVGRYRLALHLGDDPILIRSIDIPPELVGGLLCLVRLLIGCIYLRLHILGSGCPVGRHRPPLQLELCKGNLGAIVVRPLEEPDDIFLDLRLCGKCVRKPLPLVRYLFNDIYSSADIHSRISGDLGTAPPCQERDRVGCRGIDPDFFCKKSPCITLCHIRHPLAVILFNRQSVSPGRRCQSVD